MSGIGFNIQKNDNLRTFSERLILAFALHFALELRGVVLEQSNRLPATLLILTITVLLYWLEQALARSTTAGTKHLVDGLLFIIGAIQAGLAVLLVTVSDILLTNSLVGSNFALSQLYRPISFLFIIAGLLTLYKHFYEEPPSEKHT